MQLDLYSRVDELALKALSACEEEWKRDAEGAVGFLLKNGLSMDGAHAVTLAKTWKEGSKNATNDVFSGDKVQAVRDAQDALKQLFVGAWENVGRGPSNKEEYVLDGSELKMKACTMWVSTRSLYHPLFNGYRGLLRMDLAVSKRTKRDAARVFAVRKLQPPTDGEPLVVNYGETIELRCKLSLTGTNGLQERVKFVCPGRSGPVCLLDHVYVISVDKKGLPKETWTLAPTTRLGDLNSVKPGSHNGKFGELAVSPLLFTLHPAEGLEPFREAHPSQPTTPRPVVIDTKKAILRSASSSSSSSSSSRGCPAESAAQVQGEDEPSLPHLDVSVVVYNTWMMPKFWGALAVLNALGAGISPSKSARARAIPEALCSSLEDLGVKELPDVIVLCEAFCDKNGTLLKAGLKRKLGFLYELPVGGSGPFVSTHALLNSGCTVLSRYPIMRAEERIFNSKDEWAKDDGLANKCCIYVRVSKGGVCFNVVATHLQAWEYHAAVKAREAQMLCIRRFAQALRVPPTEPLIYVGDLNVCRLRCPDQYDRMLGILCASDSLRIEPDHMRLAQQLVTLQVQKKKQFHMGYYSDCYTTVEPDLAIQEEVLCNDERMNRIISFNTLNNKFCGGGLSAGEACALLDYALYSNLHRQPSTVEASVVHNMRAAEPYRYLTQTHTDLSDHYPLYARFSFR